MTYAKLQMPEHTHTTTLLLSGKSDDTGKNQQLQLTVQQQVMTQTAQTEQLKSEK